MILSYLEKKTDIPSLALGQTVFYPFRRGMIIPAKIVSIIDFLYIPGEFETFVIGRHDLSSGYPYLPSEEIEFFAPNDRILDQETMDKLVLSSRFFDIDEITGHSLQLDSDIFLTLKEAKIASYSIGKNYARNPHKKLQSWRNSFHKWVMSCHASNGDFFLEEKSPIVSRKKVYLKLGKTKRKDA